MIQLSLSRHADTQTQKTKQKREKGNDRNAKEIH